MARRFVCRVLLTAGLLGLISLLPLWESRGHAEDFVQDYLCARAWQAGEDPYQDLIAMRRNSGLDSPGNRVAYNPHPPLAILLTVPISNLSFLMSWRVFQGAQLFALAIAWNWAGLLFGYRGWRYSVLGGLTALWAPIWQGLDWGQPVGSIAFLSVMLWSLARNSRPGLCGAALCAACLVRPFFFLIGATAIHWTVRRLSIAALAATVTMLLIFSIIGVWPWIWMIKAGEAGQFSVMCGSIPGVLGLHPKIGMALFFATLLPIAVARRRWSNPDPAIALALTLAMLSYPHAWFQYDASLIPVVVWVVSRATTNLKLSNGSRRMVLWLAFLFGTIRSMPNMGDGSAVELWIQVAGRVILLLAAWLVAKGEDSQAPAGPDAGEDYKEADEIKDL